MVELIVGDGNLGGRARGINQDNGKSGPISAGVIVIFQRFLVGPEMGRVVAEDDVMQRVG